GVVPYVAGDRRSADDGVVLTERSRAAGAFLEVGDQNAVGGADTEEVVHVDVAALGLSAALGEERDGVGDAACSGARADACALAREPRLDGEGGCTEAWGRAEGHVVIRTIEVKRAAGGGRCRCRRCRSGWRRCRRPRWRGNETRDPNRKVGSRSVDAATG